MNEYEYITFKGLGNLNISYYKSVVFSLYGKYNNSVKEKFESE